MGNEQSLRTTLNELASLPAGWLGGEAGHTISERAIDRGGDVIDTMTPSWRSTATVFPTEHGGVQFYWPHTPNQLSIEVEPSGALYIHACGTRTAFRSAVIPADTALTDQLAAWFVINPTDELLSAVETITSVEELDTLPDWTVIYAAHAQHLTCQRDGYDEDRSWFATGDGYPVSRKELASAMPFRILHLPDSEDQP